MIVKNEDFYGEFYLPQAKPSLVPENSLSDKTTNFINDYSSEALLKCFGYILFEEFASKIDNTQANGIKAGSDQKWIDLLGGKTYVKEGKNVKWRGLRYEEVGGTRYKSLLVPYIYYQFKLKTQTSGTGTGEKAVRSKNSEIADVTPVLARAWNKFVEEIQVFETGPKVVQGMFGQGLDYFNQNKNQYITLDVFIKDMNELDDLTYQNYEPQRFNKFVLGL